MVESLEHDAPPAAAKPVAKRRRWPKYGSGGLVALLIATGGIGWYFSGQVIDVEHPPPEFGLTVIEATSTEVTLPADADTGRSGTWGLQWESGRAVIGAVLQRHDDQVVREIDEVLYGKLDAGTQVRVDTWTYGDDPKQSHGIDFDQVAVPAQPGDMPAWFVPGERDTWIIGVHGRNASPGEALRAIPTYHEAGYPVLAVTHRNDVGAPASSDGYHHLGDTEWRDIAAAVDYAMANGAQDVVLHGWSMGGTVAMTALRRMDDPQRVRGMILDSPVLDWNSTLDKQGSQRWLPGPVIEMAKGLAEYRAGFDLDDLDLRPYASQMSTPVLLFADVADETVDTAATLEFAENVPQELLTLVKTAAGHTASWNENPEAYAAQLGKFLTNVALAGLASVL